TGPSYVVSATKNASSVHRLAPSPQWKVEYAHQQSVSPHSAPTRQLSTQCAPVSRHKYRGSPQAAHGPSVTTQKPSTQRSGSGQSAFTRQAPTLRWSTESLEENW